MANKIYLVVKGSAPVNSLLSFSKYLYLFIHLNQAQCASWSRRINKHVYTHMEAHYVCAYDCVYVGDVVWWGGHERLSHTNTQWGSQQVNTVQQSDNGGGVGEREIERERSMVLLPQFMRGTGYCRLQSQHCSLLLYGQRCGSFLPAASCIHIYELFKSIDWTKKTGIERERERETKKERRRGSERWSEI